METEPERPFSMVVVESFHETVTVVWKKLEVKMLAVKVMKVENQLSILIVMLVSIVDGFYWTFEMGTVALT